MTSREFVLNVPVEGVVRSFDVAHERAYRSLVHTAHERAADEWRNMADDRRTALASLVQEALTELAQCPDDWLAEGLTLQDPDLIGVSILFRLGNVDTHVMQLRATAEAEKQQRIADLQRISANDPVDSPA